MDQAKIQIEMKYIKLSANTLQGLRDYSKPKKLEAKNVNFFMVGDFLEVHINDEHTIKLGDLDWKPAHSV